MTNKQKANTVAVAHFLIILFGIASLPLLFVFSWWNIAVFSFAGFTVVSWILFKGKCWVTHLENHYRKIDGSHYEIGFIKHYLKKFFNINASSFVITTSLYGYLTVLFVVALSQLL